MKIQSIHILYALIIISGSLRATLPFGSISDLGQGATKQADARRLQALDEQRVKDAQEFMSAKITNNTAMPLTLTTAGCAQAGEPIVIPAGDSRTYGKLINSQLYTLYTNLTDASILYNTASATLRPSSGESAQAKVDAWQKKYEDAQKAVRDYVAQSGSMACLVTVQAVNNSQSTVFTIQANDLSIIDRNDAGLSVEKDLYNTKSFSIVLKK